MLKLKSPLKNKNKNRKILYITTDMDSGGAENVLFNLLCSLNKNDVQIISLTNKGFYGEELKKMGYSFYYLNIRRDITILPKLWRLIFLIYKFKPSIVHTWLYHANLLGGIFAKILGVKNIFWSIHHDFELSDIFMMIEIKLLIFLSYFVPNKIIYCSKISEINHVSNGFNKSLSKVILNGVSTNKFKPDKIMRNKFRKKLDISEDCFLIGNISRYNPLKDHDNLLKSLTLLDKNINYKCLLIGLNLNNKNSSLVKKIKDYDLTERIILYGKTLEVQNIINALDIHVLSSKMEGFGMVILEAMSSGVPCISTNVGSAKDIIGETGWIVEKSNYRELAKVINYISNKKNILYEKSLMVRKRVKQNYSIEKMNFDYVQLY